jgi:surface antigen
MKFTAVLFAVFASIAASNVNLGITASANQGVQASVQIGQAAQAGEADKLQDGAIVVLRNQTNNQPMNLRGGKNGLKINGSPNNAAIDNDQRLTVRRKPGTNIVQLVANGKTVSIKGKGFNGEWLETYNVVGYFDPHQSFYVDTLPNGNLVFSPVKHPGMAINLKYGGTKESYAPYMLWDKNGIENDLDRQFKVDVVGQAPIVQPPSKTKVDLSVCNSAGYGCTRPGYAGVDSWGFHDSSSWNGNYKHNCTAYASWHASQMGASHPGINLGNAKTWGWNAASRGIPVVSYPVVNSVAVRNLGIYGHVAVVEAIDGDFLWISEDNWSDQNGGWTSRRRVHKSYFQQFILFGNVRG